MRRFSAAIGSTLFFLIAPGTMAGLIPWLITGWRSAAPTVLRVVGVVVIIAGLVPLVAAFVAFTRAGGTPSPTAPTTRLVVTGLNSHVRNPMYLGVVLMILGQALVFGRITLVLYAGAFWLVTALFVRYHEEPTLSRAYGPEYDAYRRAVRAWLPRLRPWRPSRPSPGPGPPAAPRSSPPTTLSP